MAPLEILFFGMKRKEPRSRIREQSESAPDSIAFHPSYACRLVEVAQSNTDETYLRSKLYRNHNLMVTPESKSVFTSSHNVPVIDSAPKQARQSPRPQGRGGKSGLRRAGCRLTTGHREVMESATENTPPMARLCRSQERQSLLKKSSGESRCDD